MKYHYSVDATFDGGPNRDDPVFENFAKTEAEAVSLFERFTFLPEPELKRVILVKFTKAGAAVQIIKAWMRSQP